MRRRKRMLEDLEQDIRDHIERETQDNIERGMPPEEARYAAVRKFGNVTRVKEETREVWSLVWLEELLQDIRYGLRMMKKSSGFSAVAVLTLALGIGVNAAIFSAVSAVLFRALPFRDPGHLVWATNYVPRLGSNVVFADVYAGWRGQNHAFETVAAYSAQPIECSLTGAGSPRRVNGEGASASFLDLLGVAPQLGRNFLPEEDRPGGPKAMLLSDALWRSNFGGDPGVVGRVVACEDLPYTVVGVLPANFEFLDNNSADILVPIQLSDSNIQVLSNGRIGIMIQPLNVLARLRPGATVAGAVTELNGINKRVAETLPGNSKVLGEGQVQVFSLHDHEVGNVRPALLVLLGAVGFVLLIACANVANLQLARASSREKEVAIRGALGAGQWRLARLLLTESLGLALAGGVAGLMLAAWVIRLIRRFAPENVPHLLDARLDVRMLAFTLGLSLLTGILFGLAPVLAAFRVSLNTTMKESSAQGGIGTGTRRTQRVLLIAEIALSIVLFIGAGLLVKSFRNLTAIQPGFDPHGVLTAQVSLPLDRYQSIDQQRTFFEQLAERLQALPGVTSAGATFQIPLRGSSGGGTIKNVGGRPTDTSMFSTARARMNSVTPGYFAALRVPLIEGRFLNERDGANAPPSVVVNQAFVRRFFSSEDPIGKTVTPGGRGPGGAAPPTWTIVGVVGDTKQHGLASETEPEMTASVSQWPLFTMTLVLRTSVEPLSLVSAVREEVTDLDKNLPLYGVRTLDDVLSSELTSQRFNAGALAGFAALAVLLAAVGIYGVMAYAVSQRTHEIGVRMAMGADPQTVMGMMLRQALLLTVVGVVLGLAGALGLTRLLTGMLFGLKPSDPETFATVTAALIVVALAACWIPARRAMRVDPIETLRYE